MANKNFTDFTLKTPASSDFLVGYNADGSAEYKTTVNALVSSYATNTALNALLSSYASNSISITYAQLTALSSTNSFKIGQFYTLSDFVTEYMSTDLANDYEWISPNNPDFITKNNGFPVAISAIAAKPEPLIIQAIAPNKLSHIAYSLKYPQDIIHYDPNFTDLDTLGWPPSNPTQVVKYKAKGFITYRKDPVLNLECDFDWRNVRFKRWSPVMTESISIGGVSSVRVFPLTPSTEYKVADVVTAGSNNDLVLYCIKKHTTSSTEGGSNYNNQNWVLFFKTTGLMHTPALPRPAFGRISNSGSFWLGGYGQANFYYTFSNPDGTLAANPRVGAGTGAPMTDIKISSRTPRTYQNLYSERMSNLVLFRGNSGAYFSHLTFKDVTRTTFYGGGGKTQCLFEEMFDVYVESDFFDSKLFQINYGGFSPVYFIGGSKRENDLFMISNSIISGSLNLKLNNIDRCVFSANLAGSNIENSTDCAFIFNPPNSVFGFDNTNITIKNKNALGYLVTNPPNTIVNNPRSFYFTPNLKNGISFGRQAVEINITQGSSKIPHYEYFDDENNLIRESIYGSTPLLYKHADLAVTTRLANATAVNFKDIYTTQNHNLSSYVRNLSCWCYDLAQQMTCISPWNNSVGNPGGVTGGGVLITPRHIYMSAHFQLPVGTIIRFVSQDNQVIDRTIVRTYTHPLYDPNTGNFDITVGLLDSDVPSSITPTQVVPLNFHDYFVQQNIFLTGLWTVAFPAAGCLYVDQEEKALVVDHFISTTAHHEFNAPTNVLKLSAYEPIITGDSGNPIFYIVNNKLVLLATWTGVKQNNVAIGSEYNVPIDRNGFSRSPLLQDMISAVDLSHGISTNYFLNTVNLSSFVKFTNN